MYAEPIMTVTGYPDLETDWLYGDYNNNLEFVTCGVFYTPGPRYSTMALWLPDSTNEWINTYSISGESQFS